MDIHKRRSIWSLIFITTVGSLATSTNETTKSLCKDGKTLERTQFCDGTVDCADGSDEIYSGKGFKCSLTPLTGGSKPKRCVLPQSMVLDDIADCDDESDLCFNKKGAVVSSRCYECLDGNGVISLTQVCDGVVDCHDTSDECTCMTKSGRLKDGGRDLLRNPICRQMRYSGTLKNNHLRRDKESLGDFCKIGEVLCSTSNNSTSQTDPYSIKCISPGHVCDGIVDCPLGDDEKYCPIAGYHCYASIQGGENVLGTFCDGRVDCPNFEDECSEDCWLPNPFCKNVTHLYNNHSVLECEHGNKTANNVDAVKGYRVCDGVIDCNETGTDELNCLASTHFYCIGKSPLFVDWKKYFDGNRDCVDGSDECSGLPSASRIQHLRERDAILRSGLMIFSVWFMCFFAIVGNAVVFRQTVHELWKDWREEKLGKLAKCNRILVLNLAMSDFLMGIYLLMIGISSAVTDGRYCTQDRQWRSSQTCIALGFINQLSNQSSVLTLLLMTSFRLYGTMCPFKVETSQVVHSSLICCAAIWLISLFVSSSPLLEVFQDYFTEHMWLPLPLVTMERVGKCELHELVIRLNTVAHNTTGELTDFSWTAMIEFLRDLDIKGMHPDWNIETVVPGGFYNHYSVCIPNLYSSRGETAWAYSAIIIIFNFCASCYISIAYVIIYKASSRPAVRKSVRKRSRQWRRDNKTMQRKILFLVATDVACWFPICITAIVNLVRPINMKRDLVGLTAAFLLPINSAINPLIYSSAFWETLRCIKQKIRPTSREEIFTKINSSRENSVSTDENPFQNQTRLTTVRFRSITEDTKDISCAPTVENQQTNSEQVRCRSERRRNSLPEMSSMNDIWSRNEESESVTTATPSRATLRFGNSSWRKPVFSESFERETTI